MLNPPSYQGNIVAPLYVQHTSVYNGQIWPINHYANTYSLNTTTCTSLLTLNDVSNIFLIGTLYPESCTYQLNINITDVAKFIFWDVDQATFVLNTTNDVSIDKIYNTIFDTGLFNLDADISGLNKINYCGELTTSYQCYTAAETTLRYIRHYTLDTVEAPFQITIFDAFLQARKAAVRFDTIILSCVADSATLICTRHSNLTNTTFTLNTTPSILKKVFIPIDFEPVNYNLSGSSCLVQRLWDFTTQEQAYLLTFNQIDAEYTRIPVAPNTCNFELSIADTEILCSRHTYLPDSTEFQLNTSNALIQYAPNLTNTSSAVFTITPSNSIILHKSKLFTDSSIFLLSSTDTTIIRIYDAFICDTGVFALSQQDARLQYYTFFDEIVVAYAFTRDVTKVNFVY